MYVTKETLSSSLPEEIILYYADDERLGEITPAVLTRLEDIAAQANSEVDSYLGQRYVLPLPAVPEVIAGKALIIAQYLLTRRRGRKPNSADETFEDDYRAAVAFLRDVSQGRAALPLPPSNTPAQAPRSGARVSGKPRVFSRDSLEDL